MPNELITEIEKTLEAITQGEWVNCSWDPMERPHVFAKELQTGHYCNGKADIPQTAADCHLIANAPEWLRALLEENKRLNSKYEILVNAEFRQCKEIESIRTELSAKNKVLEWYGSEMLYDREEGNKILLQDYGYQARSILSQYVEVSHETD